ncbi:hypothetical protein LOAG_03320, partial [Loa loa]
VRTGDRELLDLVIIDVLKSIGQTQLHLTAIHAQSIYLIPKRIPQLLHNYQLTTPLNINELLAPFIYQEMPNLYLRGTAQNQQLGTVVSMNQFAFRTWTGPCKTLELKRLNYNFLNDAPGTIYYIQLEKDNFRRRHTFYMQKILSIYGSLCINLHLYRLDYTI